MLAALLMVGLCLDRSWLFSVVFMVVFVLDDTKLALIAVPLTFGDDKSVKASVHVVFCVVVLV